MGQDSVDFHPEDFAWARALASGDAEALQRYEREIVPVIAAHLRRRGATEHVIDDVQQALRARLLVGDGAGPAIRRYEARGRLQSWVLVAALREFVRMRQRHAREPAVDDDALIALLDATAAAPAAIEKETYREAFRGAFRAAIAALPARDRNLLRMHVLDGLTIDQIGAMRGVHRATAARWIESARQSISRHVRRDLMRQLRIDPFELDELLGWVQSRIELSLSGLAGSSSGS